MKTTILIICILIANTIYSQSVQEYLINEITVSCDGVIVDKTKTGNTISVTVELPTIYTHHLFNRILKSIMDQYDDVYMLTAWTRLENKLILTQLAVGTKSLAVAYGEEYKILIFVFDI